MKSNKELFTGSPTKRFYRSCPAQNRNNYRVKFIYSEVKNGKITSSFGCCCDTCVVARMLSALLFFLPVFFFLPFFACRWTRMCSLFGLPFALSCCCLMHLHKLRWLVGQSLFSLLFHWQDPQRTQHRTSKTGKV